MNVIRLGGIINQARHSPECLLDTPHVVFSPVPLRDLLLAHGHAAPSHTHDGDVLDIVLVEVDLQLGEVTLGPLVQPPGLDKPGGLLQFDELARDVAAKELKLAAYLGTLEHLGRGPCEGGQALGVGEGLVQLGGGGAEFLVVGDSGGVHGASAIALGAFRRGSLGGRRGLGVDFGGGEAAGRVCAGCVLEVFAVFGDQGGGQFEELRS